MSAGFLVRDKGNEFSSNGRQAPAVFKNFYNTLYTDFGGDSERILEVSTECSGLQADIVKGSRSQRFFEINT